MNKRLEKLNDYEGFVEKFKAKKTTDDCYTPPAVYEAVLGWVRERYGLTEDVPIVRPFWPGGDYEHHDYPEDSVVIDNPPFSVLAKIVRFYQERKVRFFLFAPSLTLLGYAKVGGVSLVACSASVTYENKAKVGTAFVTNLEREPKIVLSGRLNDAIKQADAFERRKERRPVRVYPPCILTSVRLKRLSSNTDSLEIPMDAVRYSRAAVGKEKRRIYGNLLFVGEDIAKEIERIEQDIPRRIRERMKEERERMEEERERMEEEGIVELTEDELAIVRSLTRHDAE